MRRRSSPRDEPEGAISRPGGSLRRHHSLLDFRPAATAAMTLVFLSCGAAPASSPKPASTPADENGPRVQMPSGAAYRLELAKTPEEQQRGLMFRESLPPRSGMLFIFSESGVHKFWMKNTMIPLDMIWMDPNRKVLFISAETPPCRADPCPSFGPDAPASFVLEIAGGMAKREKVQVGTVLRFVNIN